MKVRVAWHWFLCAIGVHDVLNMRGYLVCKWCEKVGHEQEGG